MNDNEDTAEYAAVVNDEEQYSIWPAGRALPLGWHEAGMRGAKAEVLAWIQEVWTDMRPKSLRDRMDQAGGDPANG